MSSPKAAFASTGEKLSEFEQFHRDRMAGRILGMGDMLTLIEQAEQAFEKDQAEQAAEKLLEGEFTLDDYKDDGAPNGAWTPQPITCSKSLIERANLYYPIQDPVTGYWYPCDPNTVWRYSTEARLKPGQTLRAETIEELISKKEIYFPPVKSKEVMQWDTREDLLAAIRAGKGPMLPKKKTPLLREDLPDLAFWVGKPIAPGRPSRKDYLNRKKKLVVPVSSWIAGKNEEVDYLYDETEGQVELMRSERGGEGTDAINAILGTKAFNHAKPPSLIRSLVGQSSGGDDLVVDFFAGSGTTAQAVLECNLKDGKAGRRRFILVSSTEATPAEPDKNLCRDVCAKRVRRVIEGYGNAPALGGDFAYLRCQRIPAGLALLVRLRAARQQVVDDFADRVVEFFVGRHDFMQQADPVGFKAEKRSPDSM